MHFVFHTQRHDLFPDVFLLILALRLSLSFDCDLMFTLFSDNAILDQSIRSEPVICNSQLIQLFVKILDDISIQIFIYIFTLFINILENGITRKAIHFDNMFSEVHLKGCDIFVTHNYGEMDAILLYHCEDDQKLGQYIIE